MNEIIVVFTYKSNLESASSWLHGESAPRDDLCADNTSSPLVT